MAYSDEEIIEAFWLAVEDVPLNVQQPGEWLSLLACMCKRLNGVRPSKRLRDEAEDSREGAANAARSASNTPVRLNYVYSALGDGIVELTTHNAESLDQPPDEPRESGTVVGLPGACIRFDDAEARRAIAILSGIFPNANS